MVQQKSCCIAGMHRSGTSMVARLLNLTGVYLGPEERMIPPKPDNPAGFWENLDFVHLNDQILAYLGGGWDTVPAELQQDWLNHPIIKKLKNKATEYTQNFETHRYWGWKDPRTSLTFPFWQEILPELKMVVCVRNPLEVAASLQKRGYSSIPFGLKLWFSYNQQLLKNTSSANRIITHYEAYITNPQEELRRVLDYLEIAASDEAIEEAAQTVSTSLRHSRYSVQDIRKWPYMSEVADLYEMLCRDAGPVFNQKSKFSTSHVISTSALTSIIILTHNQIEHTKLCLQSIKDHTPEQHELIIVDNGSNNDTVDYLKQYRNSHENVTVIFNPENKGFAAGNNQGLAVAKGEFVLLLNNDTIVTNGWLKRMLAVFAQYPEVGLVGPMSNYVANTPQLIQDVYYNDDIKKMHQFAGHWHDKHKGLSIEVSRLVGFCLLIRRDVVEQIGGLDEQYGLGNFEDDDFCIRVAIAGSKIRVAQDVFVHHTGNQTFKALGIDYKQSLKDNWRLFKNKWNIPIEMPIGESYSVSISVRDTSLYYISLPSVHKEQFQPALTEMDGDDIQSAQAKEDWSLAIELIKQKIETDLSVKTKAQFYNSLGYSYFMLSQLELAEIAFLNGLEFAPNNLDLLGNLADLYLQQERYDLGTEYLNRALKINPDDVKVLMSLGHCAIELGQLQTALMAFERVQKLAPDTEGVREVINQLQTAQCQPAEPEAGVFPPPIFVGGAGRSGTTLVRVILDSHPDIVCGPEFKVLPLIAQMAYEFQTALFPTLQEYNLEREEIRNAFRELIASLLQNYYQQSGKRRLAEKTPHNALFFQHLHQLFPDSPLVHVIRDGRDVVCSLLKMNWINPRTGERLDYTADVRKAAQYWVNTVKQGRATLQRPSAAERYIELRYEDIVIQPEATLKQLFAFIGEPWDETVLNFHRKKRNLADESSAGQVVKPINTQSLERWKKDLKPKDKRIVKEVAGDLLIELGYAKDKNW